MIKFVGVFCKETDCGAFIQLSSHVVTNPDEIWDHTVHHTQSRPCPRCTHMCNYTQSDIAFSFTKTLDDAFFAYKICADPRCGHIALSHDRETGRCLAENKGIGETKVKSVPIECSCGTFRSATHGLPNNGGSTGFIGQNA